MGAALADKRCIILNNIFYFYGMHPVVYLLDNIYLSIGQSAQQLLQ
jgi:hypothetical protein